MVLTVDTRDKRPIYQQIADGIKALIARGELRQGMALPSVRQVAGDLGVNLNTIAVAYRQLQEEGLVTVRHGAGTVVASLRADRVERDSLRQALRAVLTEWILAGSGEREIAAAVKQELRALRR